ncbi:RWD domain-containing protein 4-like [Dysidea avara]|uniref:RWD domain-containing protein 4-like n=1 Tax=Dysidea avara TaxID=196820 RepID=UPI00331DD406
MASQSCADLQEEEREVLQSIYEDDDAFKALSETSFSYRFGNAGEPKACLLQVSWSDQYPSVLPTFSLDNFFNNHLSSENKAEILTSLQEQAEELLDSAATYSIIEWCRDNIEDLIIPEERPVAVAQASNTVTEDKEPKQKKEHLSKQAKRKLADRLNNKGELPRGWDWVDVVKHLSKTGPANPT